MTSERKELRAYAVQTGVTLRCVNAVSHLQAACEVLRDVMREHLGVGKSVLPYGILGKMFLVTKFGDSHIEEVSVAECIDAVPFELAGWECLDRYVSA